MFDNYTYNREDYKKFKEYLGDNIKYRYTHRGYKEEYNKYKH